MPVQQVQPLEWFPRKEQQQQPRVPCVISRNSDDRKVLAGLSCYDWVSNRGEFKTLVTQDRSIGQLSVPRIKDLYHNNVYAAVIYLSSILPISWNTFISFKTPEASVAAYKEGNGILQPVVVMQHSEKESASASSAAAVHVQRAPQYPPEPSGGLQSSEEHAREPVLSPPPVRFPEDDALVLQLEGLGYVIESWNDIKFPAATKELGQGTFGIVLEAKLWGCPVAVKMLAPETTNEKFFQEISLLRRCTGNNVVHLQGVCVHEGRKIIILEWCDTDLRKVLHSIDKKELPEKLRAQWKDGWPLVIKIKLALGVARGVSWLHNHARVVHRDLKPANCLVDGYFTVKVITPCNAVLANEIKKVADLGSGKRFPFSFEADEPPGTYEYLGPEVMIGGVEATTYKLDVYAFGMLLYELLDETPVFPEYFNGLCAEDFEGPKYYAAVDALQDAVIGGKRPTVPKVVPKGPDKGALTPQPLIDLIEECLDAQPEKRPTMEGVVSRLEALYAVCKESSGLEEHDVQEEAVAVPEAEEDVELVEVDPEIPPETVWVEDDE
ncbi:SHK1 protein [Pelomyxa schiedti]|nr:SHK1 protein [Pelomyxa schiedti]KAH3745075.1 SHK1 protein [Pelomyxa schiedti]